MARVTVKFIGSGDAFGSGGRSNTCLLLERTDERDSSVFRALIDCGASSMPALRRFEIDIAGLDAVLLSHLHGDHYAGVPFLLLDARFNSPRRTPLTVAGPAGVEARVLETLELMFPGSREKTTAAVATDFREWTLREPMAVGPLSVVAIPVVHPSGAPACALRIGLDDRVFAFSGDTEWTPALIEAANGADLFVCECYTWDRAVPFHLSHQMLMAKQPALGARRMVLTHMGADMLAHRQESPFECAEDGLTLVVA